MKADYQCQKSEYYCISLCLCHGETGYILNTFKMIYNGAGLLEIRDHSGLVA